MTGLGALAQALGSASEAVADANRTVYQIDSENEAKNLIAQIGTQTQAFHQGLYTDPDAGVPQTPGAPTEANGYMKKWADFDANVQKQIAKTASPLAKKIVSDYWNQERLQSQRQVYDRQFTAWADKTVSQTTQRIANAYNTWAGDAQGYLDYCAGELGYLKRNNLIDQGKYDEAMANYSQDALRMTLGKEAKAAYDAAGGGNTGLAAALKRVDSDQSRLGHQGNTYALGEKTKAILKQDVEAYNSEVQLRVEADLETQYSNLLRKSLGQKVDPNNPKLMTITGIQESMAMSDRKDYWIGKFTNFMNARDGDEGAKAKYRQIATVLKVMQARYNANQGRGGLEPIQLNGESLPITTARMDQLMRENFNELSYFCGDDLVEIEKGFQLMKAPNQGAWADARAEIEKSVKDPYLKAQALETFDNTHHLEGAESWDAKKIQDAKTEILAKNYLKTNLSAGLWKSNGKVEGDATKITSMLWNRELRLHIGGRDGQEPMPQMKQSRDALEQYSVAVQKSIEQFFGKDESDKQVWIPVDTQGNYQRATVRTAKDGTRTTIQPVPLVDENGKVTMTFLVTTTKAGKDHFLDAEKGIGPIASEGGTVKYELLDASAGNGKGALVPVTPASNMKENGWSLLSKGQLAEREAEKAMAAARAATEYSNRARENASTFLNKPDTNDRAAAYEMLNRRK